MGYKNPEDRKAYSREHYKNNKGKYSAASKAARSRRAAVINKLKDAPCVDCGGRFHPYVMDFDHVDDNKSADVSELLRRAGLKVVLEEVAKCELVCSNCHRMRTYKRLVDKDPSLVV